MSLLVNRETGTVLTVIVDAGIQTVRFEVFDAVGRSRGDPAIERGRFPNNGRLDRKLEENGILGLLRDPAVDRADVFVTGKMADLVREVLGTGVRVSPAAALWQAARMLLRRPENGRFVSVGIVELSASGYASLCVTRDESYESDELDVNPHCGAGTGLNLSRVLQKLDIPLGDVDTVLCDYLGRAGAERRSSVAPRADRCGVFSSSATVSDKNQGIPLDFALATTIKSEVLKACGHVVSGTGRVHLTGGVFRWRYARDCAEDFLTEERGVESIEYDRAQTLPIEGVRDLIEAVGPDGFRRQEQRLRAVRKPAPLPGFREIRRRLSKDGRFLRRPPVRTTRSVASLRGLTVNVALDVGSTMAKVVIGDASSGEPIWFDSLDNHGDTVETIKQIFRTLASAGLERLRVQHIGITGSGRYQVKKVLAEVYPHLDGRISVLVENYAHARGSIDEARERIAELVALGEQVNEKTAVLVDVGGEDTKISLIDLEAGDLVDNAMNIKCSAGTGSLLDTLRSQFGIATVEEACRRALRAPRSWETRATCAVFLMESAGKMRARGVDTNEIIASCVWAIVENMARTLWAQVKLPSNALLLLHGQTMLSDPLPLAVTERMREFTESSAFGLVPDAPGHRACIGLLRSMPAGDETIREELDLGELVRRSFEKKIITCRGAACGDPAARCKRVRLTFHSEGERPQQVRLGGCSAINDLQGRGRSEAPHGPKPVDAYGDIWRLIDRELPRSDRPDRVVLPRCFAASEQAHLLAGLLGELGLPVHVDNVVAEDVSRGQRFFDIDACAPNIGATGQMQRLAAEPHGVILVPQLVHLPTEGESAGRTCTVNQGGPLIAMRLAQAEHPGARFEAFDLSLRTGSAVEIASQLYRQWKPVLADRTDWPSRRGFLSAVERALEGERRRARKVADYVADRLALAVEEGRDVAIACAREYVLNPGVYDSHIGRLFREKGVAVIPSYVLDVTLSAEFRHVYWRNPHHVLTVVDAVKRKSLHEIVRHPRMAGLLRRIETDPGTRSRLGLSLVSSFNCGPDSMSIPMIQELTRSIPFVLIQSDGAIQELAHLENRVNTYLKQLARTSHGVARFSPDLAAQDLRRTHRDDPQGTGDEPDREEFRIEILEEFESGRLRRETDVVCIPNLGDNRVLTSVLRAAGYTCIDNFDDAAFDPEERITLGRRYAGDAICAPMAGAFGDSILAVREFVRRKDAGELDGKSRLLIFSNKGKGPCRQGQYHEAYQLLLHREKRKVRRPGASESPLKDVSIKFLTARESNGFDIGLPEWALLQSFQGIVVKGVLGAMFLTGGAACGSRAEFLRFQREFRELKREVYGLLERTRPSRLSRTMVRAAEGVDRLVEGAARAVPFAPIRRAARRLRVAKVARFFGYGFHHNNGLRTALRRFSARWIRGGSGRSGRVRIHLDGEVYARVVLSEGIFAAVADAIGFGSFEMSLAPLWSYLEYMPEESIREIEEETLSLGEELEFTEDAGRRSAIVDRIRECRIEIEGLKETVATLRGRIVGPLYRAAGLAAPHPVEDALRDAEEIFPTGKPYGELLPYVGDSIRQLRAGTDLILNVAPAGCMVATMGGISHPLIRNHVRNSPARIQTILTQNGELDAEAVEFALLRRMGPVELHRDGRAERGSPVHASTSASG